MTLDESCVKSKNVVNQAFEENGFSVEEKVFFSILLEHLSKECSDRVCWHQCVCKTGDPVGTTTILPTFGKVWPNDKNKSNSVKEVKTSVKIGASKKHNSHYKILHDHHANLTHSGLVFLRQFFYMRLKVMFGETLAKLFVDWIQEEGKGVNIPIEDTHDETVFYKFNVDIAHINALKKFPSFCEKFFNNHIFEKIDKDIHSRKLLLSYDTVKQEDEYETVKIELASNLGTKSNYKTIYKLSLCLNEFLYELRAWESIVKDTNKLDWIFSEVPKLSEDSITVKFNREIERLTLNSQPNYIEDDILINFFESIDLTSASSDAMFPDINVWYSVIVSYRLFLVAIGDFLICKTKSVADSNKIHPECISSMIEDEIKWMNTNSLSPSSSLHSTDYGNVLMFVASAVSIMSAVYRAFFHKGLDPDLKKTVSFDVPFPIMSTTDFNLFYLNSIFLFPNLKYFDFLN